MDKIKDLINPIKIREFNYNIIKDPVYIVYPNKVRELEQNYREAIESLIRIIRYQLFVEQSEHLQTYKEAKEICKKDIGIVEKLTGQKWEALKNMEDSDG